VSYRHSSYRKVSQIVRKTIATVSGDSAQLLRFEMDRVLHWSQQPALPKPRAWSKPKGWRE
jgi:hypothetical protein